MILFSKNPDHKLLKAAANEQKQKQIQIQMMPNPSQICRFPARRFWV